MIVGNVRNMKAILLSGYWNLDDLLRQRKFYEEI